MDSIKKRKKIFLFLAFSILTSIVSYVSLWRYHAIVTESAFSLCAAALQGNESAEEKAIKVKDFLTFADLSEERKQKIILAIKKNNALVEEIKKEFAFFSYSPLAMRRVEEKIDELEETSMEVFRVSKTETSVANAEELLRKLYGKRVTFRVEEGDGSSVLKRFFCENICIDACADGSLRYLSDVFSAGGVDPLLAVLHVGKIEIVSETSIGDFLFQTLHGTTARAEVCIYLPTGRIFAAKILFNS